MEYITRAYFDAEMKVLKDLIMAQQQHPDFVTIVEAARLLNVSRTFIYTLIEEGKLVATQISPRKKQITYKSVMDEWKRREGQYVPQREPNKIK